MSPLPQQQDAEAILTAIDLEKTCSCQLATTTAAVDKKNWRKVDKGAATAAVMWALMALILFLFIHSYFTI